MRGFRSAVALCVSLVAFVGVVSAHDAGASRFDAPIPFTFLYGGAAATVGVTALWLGTGTETAFSARARRSLPASPSATISPALATRLRYAARAVFFAGFVFVIIHGVFGPQQSTANFATVFVWGLWVSGISLLSILAGSPWRVLSPWRALYDGFNRIGNRELAVVGGYPTWLRSWPALVGFVGLGIIENLTIVPQSPSMTALLVVLYASMMVVGALAFGSEWFRHADVFSVLYRLFGRVAPIEVVRTPENGYRISLRRPWSGCTVPVRDASVVVLVVTAVYTVSFDGFSSTPAFQRLLFTARNVVGTGLEASGVLLYGVGLLVFVGSFVAVSELVRRLADDDGWRSVARSFAPTVLPIAAAYEVAHYYPFVLENVGRLPAVVGSVISVSIAPIEPLGWLTVAGFWLSQVVLIVAGHVVAVVAAHRTAADRYASLAVARRAHDPLVALMIGYTVLSLWIIS